LFSQTNLFEKEIFVLKNDTLRYRILAPIDYDVNEKYPVHLFLHGSGERGNDNELQLFHGSNLFLNVNNRKI
jgi:predicted peptidase